MADEHDYDYEDTSKNVSSAPLDSSVIVGIKIAISHWLEVSPLQQCTH